MEVITCRIPAAFVEALNAAAAQRHTTRSALVRAVLEDGFVEAYGDRPIRSIDHLVIAESLKGGRNRGTVPALRAMLNDARRLQAGMLVDRNPFAGLGLKRSKGVRRCSRLGRPTSPG